MTTAPLTTAILAGTTDSIQHEAALTAARAEAHKQGLGEDQAAGEKAGHAAANARAKTILTCEQAAGRMPLALVFAFETDMSAEAAVKALAAAPLASEAKGTPPLQERGSPPVPGGTQAGTGRQTVEASWDDAVAAINGKVAERAPAPRRS